MSSSQSASGARSGNFRKVEHRPAQPSAFVSRDIQHMKSSIVQEPAYLDYGTTELVEEHAYTHLSVDQSPGPPLLKPTRPAKYAQLQYNAPPPGRIVERRTVSLTLQSAGAGNIAGNIAGRRVVSMPEATTPTQKTVHARLSSAAHSRNTTFSDMSTTSTSNDIAYYHPSDSLRLPPADLPQTPSPPSSPESVFIINNNLGDSDKKLLSHHDESRSKTYAPERPPSPPRPIPALHGPSSLPYARCPSGAEGTVVEGEDLSRMIWGLDAGEKFEGDATDRIIDQVTRTPSVAAFRHRTTSAERSHTVNVDAANRSGPVQGSARQGDQGHGVVKQQTASSRQLDEHSPRDARQQPAPMSSPSAHGNGVLNAVLKPSAPTFVPRSPPGLHRPSATGQERSAPASSIVPPPARRMSAMEIAQQYRQSQLQPAFTQRSPTPEWTFSPYLEPISAPPTFASRSRPVRHGFDDIFLPKPDSPIRIDAPEDTYREPTFEDIYFAAERLAQVQHYPEPGMPRSPVVVRRPLPPVIGEHREQTREGHGMNQQPSSVPGEYAHAPDAPRHVHYAQYGSDVHHSPTSARSPVNHRSPKPPGPPPNTPLPPLPARAPRRVLQEYIMYEDPAEEEYAIQHAADLHHQPRSVPLARLMQRRLSAVPEELEDTSLHYERPPPPSRPVRATYASTVLRQPLPPSAQPSWRAKTKFPVPKETEILSRGPTRVRRVVLVEEDEDPYRWGPSLASTAQDRDNSKRVPLTPMTNRSRSSSIASSSKGDQEPLAPIDKENKASEPVRKPKKKVRGGRKIKSKKAAANK
ncbi:hypothetical protein EV715DRAFT_286080 [Schizophyllum commune]